VGDFAEEERERRQGLRQNQRAIVGCASSLNKLRTFTSQTNKTAQLMRLQHTVHATLFTADSGDACKHCTRSTVSIDAAGARCRSQCV
jgi:hypothetical protein